MAEFVDEKIDNQLRYDGANQANELNLANPYLTSLIAKSLRAMRTCEA